MNPATSRGCSGVPQLQLAAAAAEALPRTGGGAGLQQLVGRAQQAQEGQRHLDDVSRLTEAVHRQVPQLRYARAERRGVERAAGEVKTLRAHGFNQRPRFEQVVGYLERNEPLLDQPDRKATSFVTSHFYLDDFVQSSEDPNPRPLQHTPLQAIPEDGFRTPAEATDEDVRLARRYQTAEPALLRTTWRETARPAPWPATATGRGRPPARTACAALQTARRRQRTS